MHYTFDSDGNEETLVDTGNDKFLTLREYLQSYVSDSQHELIRTHVLNSSRIYNHRVKAFIKNIIMDKQNPMAVKYYSTKVEFQGRGAEHNHGVLWLDLEKMEYYLENDDGQWNSLDEVISSLALLNVSAGEVKELLKTISYLKSEKETQKVVITEHIE